MLEHLASRKIKVGVLDFGDGRAFLQEPLAPVNRQFRDALVSRLERDEFEVVIGDDVIWQNDIAVRNGRRLMAAGVGDLQFLRLGVAAVRARGGAVLPAARLGPNTCTAPSSKRPRSGRELSSMRSPVPGSGCPA